MAHANSWRGVSDPRPWTPPEYDAEVDPDPRLIELEVDVDRLMAALHRWGRHDHECPAR